jgi:hypothetical protein
LGIVENFQGIGRINGADGNADVGRRLVLKSPEEKSRVDSGKKFVADSQKMMGFSGPF